MSAQIALFKDGRLVYMMERREIEGKYAEEIARELTEAFDKFCDPAGATTTAATTTGAQSVVQNEG